MANNDTGRCAHWLSTSPLRLGRKSHSREAVKQTSCNAPTSQQPRHHGNPALAAAFMAFLVTCSRDDIGLHLTRPIVCPYTSILPLSNLSSTSYFAAWKSRWSVPALLLVCMTGTMALRGKDLGAHLLTVAACWYAIFACCLPEGYLPTCGGAR